MKNNIFRSEVMLLEKVDSIIFDLDGTMWDSLDAIVEIWNEAIKDFNDIDAIITREKLKSVVGVPVIRLFFQIYKRSEQLNL